MTNKNYNESNFLLIQKYGLRYSKQEYYFLK